MTREEKIERLEKLGSDLYAFGDNEISSVRLRNAIGILITLLIVEAKESQ